MKKRAECIDAHYGSAAATRAKRRISHLWELHTVEEYEFTRKTFNTTCLRSRDRVDGTTRYQRVRLRYESVSALSYTGKTCCSAKKQWTMLVMLHDTSFTDIYTVAQQNQSINQSFTWPFSSKQLLREPWGKEQIKTGWAEIGKVNKCTFSRCLNVSSDGEELTSDGRP